MNSIWRDCKKQPPLVDDGELVLMDSNDKFWVGFCEITSDGVSYFANNAEPLKNDFVKYARIDKLLALENELERTRKALETIRLHLMTAKGRFNLYDEYLVSGMDSPDARFIKEEIEKALEQITALEQKDK